MSILIFRDKNKKVKAIVNGPAECCRQRLPVFAEGQYHFLEDKVNHYCTCYKSITGMRLYNCRTYHYT